MNICNNNNKDTYCPLCRKDIECNDLLFCEKYNSSHKEFNFLDKLENFNNDDLYKLDKYYCKYCNNFQVGKSCFNCD